LNRLLFGLFIHADKSELERLKHTMIKYTLKVLK
jgi:hypothetical protein